MKYRHNKPIYNRQDWVLCTCDDCGEYNYVEPHGTTAECKCDSNQETEHSNIPYSCRDISGCYLVSRVAMPQRAVCTRTKCPIRC